MAFALRAVNSIATAAPLRSVARRSARAPAARVAVRAMADEAPEAPEGVEQLIDARVGKVIKAYKHAEADKLYVEEVDVGEAEPRQICSGLVPYMNAEVRAAHSAPDPRVARVAPRHPRPSRLIATVHTNIIHIEALKPANTTAETCKHHRRETHAPDVFYRSLFARLAGHRGPARGGPREPQVAQHGRRRVARHAPVRVG